MEKATIAEFASTVAEGGETNSPFGVGVLIFRVAEIGEVSAGRADGGCDTFLASLGEALFVPVISVSVAEDGGGTALL